MRCCNRDHYSMHPFDICVLYVWITRESLRQQTAMADYVHGICSSSHHENLCLFPKGGSAPIITFPSVCTGKEKKRIFSRSLARTVAPCSRFARSPSSAFQVKQPTLAKRGHSQNLRLPGGALFPSSDSRACLCLKPPGPHLPTYRPTYLPTYLPSK